MGQIFSVNTEHFEKYWYTFQVICETSTRKFAYDHEILGHNLTANFLLLVTEWD